MSLYRSLVERIGEGVALGLRSEGERAASGSSDATLRIVLALVVHLVAIDV